MFGRATIRLGIGPHSSFVSFLYATNNLHVVLSPSHLETPLMKHGLENRPRNSCEYAEHESVKGHEFKHA